MDIKIEGNPGTGNTFQEIHIGYVENYNPNATTVVTNHYGDRRKPQPAAADDARRQAEIEQRQAEILAYVGRLQPVVAKEWRNRYESTWRAIIALPCVAEQVYNPGKQQGTTFNRNLVANIIYIMYKRDMFPDQKIAHLAEMLEGDKEHSVRQKLGMQPDDSDMSEKIAEILG